MTDTTRRDETTDMNATQLFGRTQTRTGDCGIAGQPHRRPTLWAGLQRRSRPTLTRLMASRNLALGVGLLVADEVRSPAAQAEHRHRRHRPGDRGRRTGAGTALQATVIGFLTSLVARPSARNWSTRIAHSRSAWGDSVEHDRKDILRNVFDAHRAAGTIPADRHPHGVAHKSVHELWV